MIYLNGVPVPESEVTGFNDYSIRENSDGAEFSGEVCFMGATAKSIFSNFFCSDIETEIIISFRAECCQDRMFSGKLSRRNAKICQNSGDCFKICATLEPSGIVNEKINCLKNILIWDTQNGSVTTAGEDEGRPAVFLKYCNEIKPNFLAFVILLIGRIALFQLRTVFFILAAIVTVINLIIDAVNIIPGVDIANIDFDGNDDTNTFDEANLLLDEIERWITGCSYLHKAPFLYSYLENIAKLCGLELDAPLFAPGGYYENAVRLDASFTEGGSDTAEAEISYIENRPNLNGIQYLDGLAEWNIGWFIDENCILHVDRVDRLGANAGAVSLLDIDGYCIEPAEGEICAFGIYEYGLDGLDRSGDEVAAYWSDTVIDWNDPPNSVQRGLCKKTLTYSAAKFRRDKLARRSPLDTFAGAVWPSVAAANNAMLLGNGVSALPKLLIYDGQSPAECALVERVPVGDGKFCYNWKFHISEETPFGETAYQQLFEIDNPRVSGFGVQKISLTFIEDCNHNFKIGDIIDVNLGECLFYNLRIESVNYTPYSIVITGKGYAKY